MTSCRVLFQAIAFGFGPASQAVVLASELRDSINRQDQLELIGLGHSVAYDFFKGSEVFDRVLKWDSESTDCSASIQQVVDSAHPRVDRIRRVLALQVLGGRVQERGFRGDIIRREECGGDDSKGECAVRKIRRNLLNSDENTT